jgi:hypothetical protein
MRFPGPDGPARGTRIGHERIGRIRHWSRFGMSWEQWRADNLAGWEDRVPIHTGPGGYDVAGLLADPARLTNTVRHDREALGPLTGLRVAHLQCHLGTDTLSLARMGAAEVTGLDFSPRAIAHCRSLFERAGRAGRFVEGDVHDADGCSARATTSSTPRSARSTGSPRSAAGSPSPPPCSSRAAGSTCATCIRWR